MVLDVLTTFRRCTALLEPLHEELLDDVEAVDAVQFINKPGRTPTTTYIGNVSESNVLAKQVSGRLARRVMDHQSIISF